MASAGAARGLRPRLIVIGGPTASGKSSLALALARALDALIVNADSMQMYRDLHVLTARPSAAEEQEVPHRLFGILDAAEVGSAGSWLDRVEGVLGEARNDDRTVIVVGGTGLYLRALLHGLAPVPEVPHAVRAEVRALFAREGRAGLRAELQRADPEMAGRLRPSDPQRQMRALEVVRATGRSLASWHQERVELALPGPRLGIALYPDRTALRLRIASRLADMIDAGALDELEQLRRRQLDPDLPLLKAVAVPELMAHLEGRLRLDEAMARATHATRRFAKRQVTWLRHQLPELEPVAGFGDETDATHLLGVVTNHRPPR